jgi:5-methylthioribose kinase
MTDRFSEFKKTHPNRFLLVDSIPETENYLKDHDWISAETHLTNLEKPGEGNMNYVLRAEFDNDTSMILKQARPWVEKYPQIYADEGRLLVEKAYYKIVESNEVLARLSPEIIDFDEENNILSMEDLGSAADFSFIYKEGYEISVEDGKQCIGYLNELSRVTKISAMPDNMEMRKLNFQHIFSLPFSVENGFDLDEVQDGLQRLADPVISNKELFKKVTEWGDRYLGEGEILVHGDFYPGSMLKTKDGVKVIDPEFSFIGPVEWDISIFVAHLFMAEINPNIIEELFGMYEQPDEFSETAFAGFVGTEIIRRIIGLAQLPLSLTLPQKKELLEKATSWIINGKVDFT